MDMADGWARHRQTPGVATATCGPGVTQLATACVVAARAESPVVAFVGERPTKDPDYHQGLNQSRFADGVETGFIRLDTGEFADEAVRRAFYKAKLERRPIMLSCPMDVQQEKWDDDDPYRPSATLKPHRAGALDAAAVEQAAALIARSKKPVIIVGRGAIWSGTGDAVLRLGERIGALIGTSLRAKTWLADKTEYHAGVSGPYATRATMPALSEGAAGGSGELGPARTTCGSRDAGRLPVARPAVGHAHAHAFVAHFDALHTALDERIHPVHVAVPHHPEDVRGAFGHESVGKAFVDLHRSPFLRSVCDSIPGSSPMVLRKGATSHDSLLP